MAYEAPVKDLVTLFTRTAERRPDKPLFGVKREGAWTWLSYGEVARRVDHFRAALAGLGIGRGDRVAVIANNRVEWAVGAFAVYGLGAAYVPMYEAQLDKEWAFILSDSGARACLCANAGIAARVKALEAQAPALRHVIDLDAEFATLCARGAAAPVPAVVPDPKELCAIVYTSGTTGVPKGVRLTHSNLAQNATTTADLVEFQEGDTALSFLPWAHVFGGSTELNGIIYKGAALALCESVDKLVQNLGEVRPTILFAVPRVWNRVYENVQKALAEKPAFVQRILARGMSARGRRRRGEPIGLGERIALRVSERLLLSKIRARLGGRLRFAVSGAAALSRDVAEFIDNLGIVVLEGYGMTEVSSCATASLPEARRLGAVGRPIPGVRVELDRSVHGAGDDEGEIVIYGHGVMDGYHNRPDETAKIMTPDGGLRSGDLGRFDADGFLYVTGRVKELYKLENGKYVAPAPIEETITLSPYIAQVMIHGSGRPHNVALVVPDLPALRAWAKEHGVEEAELLGSPRTRALIQAEIERLSAELKGYEKVKDFVLIGEEMTTQNGMLTPTLKVKRRVVLERYGALLDRLYAETSSAAG